MKTYTITIEIEEVEESIGFIDKLLNQARENKKQLDFATKVNIEAKKLHRESFVEIISKIDKELSRVGISSQEPFFTPGSNGYCPSRVNYVINGKTYQLKYESSSMDSQFYKKNKYEMYDGNPKLKIRSCDTDMFREIDGIYAFFSKIEYDIAEYIRKNVKL